MIGSYHRVKHLRVSREMASSDFYPKRLLRSRVVESIPSGVPPARSGEIALYKLHWTVFRPVPSMSCVLRRAFSGEDAAEKRGIGMHVGKCR